MSFLLWSCSNDESDIKSENNPFIGIWISEKVAGQNYTLEFKSDLTFYYSAGSQKGTYTVNGNTALLDLKTGYKTPATLIDATHLNMIGTWTKK